MKKKMINETFNEIINIMKNKYNIKNAIIREILNDNLVSVSYYGFKKEEAEILIKIGSGITGRCAQENKIIIVNDLDSYKGGYIKGIDNAKSEICIPIRKNNIVIGTLNIESCEKNNFSPEFAKNLESIANILASALSTTYSEASLKLAKTMALLNS